MAGFEVTTEGPQLWITYVDENGKQIKESAHTTDAGLAEEFRNKRLNQVSERKLIPTRKFESVTVGELLDFWWEKHAKHRNNKFQYLLPRLKKFRPLKARNLSSEMVQDFLDDLLKSLSPSSVNHYRTILNSAFNFALKWKKYDDNPVIPIRQVPEHEARDRFVGVEELVKLIEQCRKGRLRAAGLHHSCCLYGNEKGRNPAKKVSEVGVDEEYPFIYAAKTKNKRPKRLPLPALAVYALRNLPSYGKHEYLFPAKPNARFKDNFSKPHAWDLGKRFRRVCKEAGITDLRIHDLRHFATTMLFMEGVAGVNPRNETTS